MPDKQIELGSIQEQFLSALQHPYQTDNFSADLAINPSSRLSGVDCLAIYQRSYYARLLSCMREQFPALCHCLGRPVFDAFSTGYLSHCPPASYTLYELGRRFPGYLYDTRPNQGRDESEQEVWVNFMLDLADFEFRAFTLFDAPGDEASAFATLNTPDEALVLQKCFALCVYRFDVADYYHSVRHQQNPTLPPMRQTKLALVRKDYLTRTFYLSEPHYYFLSALQSGGTVATALAGVAGRFKLPLGQVTSSWNDPEGIRKRWIKSRLFLEIKE